MNILIWHIHGSYLNAITRAEHNWYLPVKDDPSGGYGGRSGYDLPSWVREVPAERVRDLDLDLVIYQTPKNAFEDAAELLGGPHHGVPAIYLEHNIPRPSAVDSRHPAADLDCLLVHVTHYNRLMWDNGNAETRVIEHSVAIDSAIRYDGRIERGITVVNDIRRRGRLTGWDLFEQARQRIPLDLAGIESTELGGIGDLPFDQLHPQVAQHRFLFSPIRYTSLPLAVIEALTIGCPVVAFATTELPRAIENGVNGYISCDPEELIDRMTMLLREPETAKRLGANARERAAEQFGLDRFIRDWDAAIDYAVRRSFSHVRSHSTGIVTAAHAS